MWGSHSVTAIVYLESFFPPLLLFLCITKAFAAQQSFHHQEQSFSAHCLFSQLHAGCPVGKQTLIWLNCGGKDMGKGGRDCDCLGKCRQTPKARRCLFFSIACIFKSSLFLSLSLSPLLKGGVCGGFVVDKQLVTRVAGPYLSVLRVFLIDSLTSSPCPLSPGPSQLPMLNY